MEMGPDVALIAGLIGEPVRAGILTALLDGRALPAGELAFIGNVTPQTASFHLGKLLDALLIRVERQGRHSYYRLANDAVATALESLAALAPMQEQVRTRYQARFASAGLQELRYARSCYKHLAGKLAVEINCALLRREFIVTAGETAYGLTPEGCLWLRELGVKLPEGAAQGKSVGRACLDWTERHHHVGGALGVTLFAQMKELGWLAANAKTRSVRVTQHGVRELERQLGVRAGRC